MTSSLATVALIMLFATSACGVLPPEFFGHGTEDRPMAMPSWGAEWEPLEEVFPPDAPGGAQLAIVELDEGVLLGEEGHVAFAKLTRADGTVILDLRIRRDGGAIAPIVPPGDYELTGYYRTCDANCGYLDPPEDICTTQVSLEPERSYLIAISMDDGCIVEEGS